MQDGLSMLRWLTDNWIAVLGFTGALLTISAFSMRRVLTLRILAVCCNLIFIPYGFLAPSYPQLLQHGILLPLNVLRILEVLRQMGKAKRATTTEISIDWLQPFMTARQVKAGETIFRKGDHAEALYYTKAGSFRLVEIDKTIGPGEILGEIGFLIPDGGRTLTLECTADGTLLELTYPRLIEMYYQNPTFGLQIMCLTARRLQRELEGLRSQPALINRAARTGGSG